MKLIFIALVLSLFASISSAKIVRSSGQQYNCTPASDDEVIALTCYENCRKTDGDSWCRPTCNANGVPGVALYCYDMCRDGGDGHSWCESVCGAQGEPGVKLSCYKRCIAGGDGDSWCKATCN